MVTYSYDAVGGGFAGLTRVGCRGAIPSITVPITSTVPVTAGVTYYTQVSDNGSGGGSVNLTFRFFSPPANDMFGSATTVTTLPWHGSADLWAATVETAVGEKNPCGLGTFTAKRTIWYLLIAPGDGDVTITVSGDGYDAPAPTVYMESGPVLSQLGSPVCGTASATSVSVRAGQAYYVQVSDASTGWGSVAVDFVFGAAVRPANDDFESATAVSSLPWSDSVDIRRATMQTNFGEPNPCGGGSHTIWYAFTPDMAGFVTVDPAGSTFSDPALTAYYAWGRGFYGLSLTACSPFTGPMRFTVYPGTTYFVQAADRYSGGGRLKLSFTFAPLPPPNDDRSYATNVPTLPFSDSVDITSATAPWPEYSPCGNSTRTVWYRYTAPATGAVTIDSVGSDFSDGSLNVYTDGPGRDWFVGCGSSGAPFTFGARAGWTYFVQAADGGSGAARYVSTSRRLRRYRTTRSPTRRSSPASRRASARTSPSPRPRTESQSRRAGSTRRSGRSGTASRLQGMARSASA